MRPAERVRDGVDALPELSVVGSFSRIGPALRRRLFAWSPPSRLEGLVAVVTGATSGVGRQVALEFASRGARTVIVARDATKAARVRDEIAGASGNPEVAVVVADMGDLESVRGAAAALAGEGAIDVLVHNAGALERSLTLSAQGLEQTVAAQLVGPFLLTELLRAPLSRRRARVIWVTSGGMYAEPLDVARLESRSGPYDGVRTYARVKRAQVSLVEYWAPRLVGEGITMVAMHPGWTDTPGLRRSLPVFARLVAPVLRSAAQGADTVVWLAAAPASTLEPGTLWLDRRARAAHRLARTRRSDTAEARERLWRFLRKSAGLGTVAA